MACEEIEEKIKSGFLSLKELRVVDLSDGCGDKFSLLIVTDEFKGIPLLKRHRKVHKLLENEMKTIHALELKTYTTEQYNKKLNS